MANNVFAATGAWLCKYSAKDQAILNPSNVLVPRPTSSSRMSDLGVALFRMFAASFISTRNVLSPAAKLSEAPTRVNILSTIPMVAASAGTKLPTWASKTIKPVWRRIILLPAIFGPVMIMICWSELFSWISFGIKGSPIGRVSSTTGCLPFLMDISSESRTSGLA